MIEREERQDDPPRLTLLKQFKPIDNKGGMRFIGAVPSKTAAWSALLALTLFVAYLSTLLPGVGYFDDTIEFQFVAQVLGIPHPTGYPTYIALSFLFGKLFPLGTLAYKANLLSSLFAVLTCLLLFRIILMTGTSAALAFLTVASFGFTKTFWSQAVVAEVYTLHALFTAIVLFFLFRWDRNHHKKDFLLACLFYSISFGNHLQAITLLPALAWFTRRMIRLRNVPFVLISIILGASQYLYVFWSARSQETPFLWTLVYNNYRPDDIASFLFYVSGDQFRDLIWRFSFVDFVTKRIPFFFELLVSDFVILLVLVALTGIATMRQTRFRTLCLFYIGTHVVWSINYDIRDIHLYLIPVYLVTTIFVAVGWQTLLSQTVASARNLPYSSPLKWFTLPFLNRLFLPFWYRIRSHSYNLTWLIIVLLPALLFLLNRPKVDQSKSVQLDAGIKEVIRRVPAGSPIVADRSDLFMGLQYYKLVEGEIPESEIRLQYGIDRRAAIKLITEQSATVVLRTEGAAAAFEEAGMSSTRLPGPIFHLQLEEQGNPSKAPP